MLPLITIVKVVGAVLSIASSYKLVFLMQVHSFCADCCNKGYHSSSTEGGIQWCLYCVWIDGYWSASNYSFKSSFIRGALPGACLVQSKKCILPIISLDASLAIVWY